MKSLIYNFAHEVMEFFGKALGINVYAAILSSDAGFVSPSWIYGFFPDSPIRPETGGLYSDEWSWPEDFFRHKTYPGGTTIVIASDLSGCTKGYELNTETSEALLNSGWGVTVTQEGSVIYHGPRNDPRSEICVLVPFGFSLTGLDIGSDLSVTQAIGFNQAGANQTNWERDEAYTRQVFNVLYGELSEPKQIIQEVTWDTDTLIPCVKTTYPYEQVRRFDIKEYRHYWYQGAQVNSGVYKWTPILSFGNTQSNTYQIRLAANNFDWLKAKYLAEPNLFDKYRNPDLVP